VFYFENGGSPEMFCSSADWMERNFFRRVEIAFPIRREELRGRILRDLETYLWDNTHAWVLDREGQYRRAIAGTEPAVDSQAELLETYAAGNTAED
jgi:polyphosphate kinase